MARHFPQFSLSCPCCTPSPRIPFARKSSAAIGCVRDLQPMQVHLYLRLGRPRGYRIGDRTSRPACVGLKQATRARLLSTGRPFASIPSTGCGWKFCCFLLRGCGCHSWRPTASIAEPRCTPDCTTSGIKTGALCARARHRIQRWLGCDEQALGPGAHPQQLLHREVLLRRSFQGNERSPDSNAILVLTRTGCARVGGGNRTSRKVACGE